MQQHCHVRCCQGRAAAHQAAAADSTANTQGPNLAALLLLQQLLLRRLLHRLLHRLLLLLLHLVMMGAGLLTRHYRASTQTN
jgi:membrane protein required for beta-lactamase induction